MTRLSGATNCTGGAPRVSTPLVRGKRRRFQLLGARGHRVPLEILRLGQHAVQGSVRVLRAKGISVIFPISDVYCCGGAAWGV